MNPENKLSENVVKIEILQTENDNDTNILEPSESDQLDIEDSTNQLLEPEQIILDNNILNCEEYNIPKNLTGRKKNQFLRMRGLAYIGGTKKCPKPIEARKLGEPCKSLQCAGSKMRHCNEFTEKQRTEIFRKFWYKMNWLQKKSYVKEHVTVAEPSRRRIGSSMSRRQNTMKFYLNLNNKKLQVCKTMFSSTLSLGDTFVREWVRKEAPFLKNKTSSSANERENDNLYYDIDENNDYNYTNKTSPLNISKKTDNITSLNVEIIKSQSQLPNTFSKFNSILSTDQRKEIGNRCKTKYCRNNKCLQIQNEERNLIYFQFWFEMSESEKLLYIQKNIEVIRTGPIKPNIMDTYYYFLKIRKRRYPVCKKMFLSTLGLIEKNVEIICDDYKKYLMKNTNDQIDEEDEEEENESDESKSDNDNISPKNNKTHKDPLDVNIEYIDVNVDVHMNDEYSNLDLGTKQNFIELNETNENIKSSIDDIGSKFRDDNETDNNSSLNDTDHSSWKNDIKNEFNYDDNSDEDSITETSVTVNKKQKAINYNQNVYLTRSSKKLLPIKKSNESDEEISSSCNKNDNIIKRKPKQNRTTQHCYEQLSNVELSNGIIIPPRIGPACKSTLCKKIPNRRCSDITEEQRIYLFKHFWYEMSLSDRKQYVKDNIEKFIELKIQKYKYKLIILQEQLLVCKKMFMYTLCLHEICIRNWLNNIENYDYDLSNDNGKKSIDKIRKDDKRMNENTMEKLQILDEFLDTLPKIPPKTFITQNPNKIYLNENIISIRYLYHMYTAQIIEDGIGYPLSQTFLTKRLSLKNLTFYRGKKLRKGNIDQDNQISDIEKVKFKLGQQEKYRDKALARKSSSTILLNIDSLKVKMSPNIKCDDDEQCDNSNTRLCCYNFTVCNILSLDSISYWFCETDASNTNNSSYITCLLDYFNNYCKNSQQIIIYANIDDIRFKNIDMSNALLDYSIQMNKIIIQKFLPISEKVETECDIIHTSISRKLKRFEIMLPSDYLTATVDARKEPCAAKWMNFRVFKDFSVQTKKHRYYKLESSDGKLMDNFNAILYKENGEILYKNEFDDEWSIIPQNCKYSEPVKGIDWPQLYLERRKISPVKYQSLQSLKVQLPRDCHFFYDYLTIEI